MISKDSSRSNSQLLVGALLFAMGIGVGGLIAPDRLLNSVQASLASVNDSAEEPLAGSLDMRLTPVESTELETLYIDLAEPEARSLQDVVRTGRRRGMILQDSDEMLPARIRFAAGPEMRAKVRIKGDFLDHIDTDKWSLRIQLQDGHIEGMRRFSIQHPKTRGYIWEWLIMAMARHEGLIAPRSRFIQVVLNGNSTGIYYLEEHFSKELLESQGRREGPIVRFSEDAYWSTHYQYSLHTGRALTESVKAASLFTSAEPVAYGQGRIAQIDGLNRQLDESLRQLRDLQAQVLWSRSELDELDLPTELRRLQAVSEMRAQTVDEIIDVDSMSRMHALYALFRCKHGLAWPNMRFYHNPLTGRLEPIVFDTLAGKLLPSRDPLQWPSPIIREFLASPNYYEALFENLEAITRPGHLMEVLDALRPELESKIALLRSESMEVPSSAEIENILRDQQAYLRNLLSPAQGVRFSAVLEENSEAGPLQRYTVVVEARALTRVPVSLRGFRFSNGRIVLARESLAPEAIGTWLSHGQVVLPVDGTPVRFRFPSDERLASLRRVEAEKQAVADHAEVDRRVRLQIDAEYNYIGSKGTRREPLKIRQTYTSWDREGTRPNNVTLAEALDQHDFLTWEDSQNRLRIRGGEWEVDGDLVVPKGLVLYVGPDVTLRFAEGTGILTTGPLEFHGSPEHPIVFEPQADVGSWSGILVLEQDQKSQWRHVIVRRTSSFARRGWLTTGGVTFYRSPVSLSNSQFVDARGEDSVNIYGAEFSMQEVQISGSASDSFDGDFVSGAILDSVFVGSVEDAIDVSGSNITIENVTCREIGDKCISAGENSKVLVKNVGVEKASIGVAAKDRSSVTIDGLEIERAQNYGIAVYVKKPEYGPSSVDASRVSCSNCGRGLSLVQEGSELRFNGQLAQTQPVDVEALYKEKILGQ